MNRRMVFVVMLVALNAPARLAGEVISLAVKGSYTTNTRFLYNVDRLDSFLDDKYFSVNFGIGFDVRWRAYGDDILVGVNVEKIKTVEQTSRIIQSGSLEYRIPIQEGFVTYPVEFSGYFVIPFSSEDVRMYLGGGVGWYFGERLYSIAQVNASTLNSPSGFGIHVLTGVDVRLLPRLAIRGELKFRDPQFDSVNQFDASSATYGGMRILLDQSQTKTRINLNGITYGLGLVISL